MNNNEELFNICFFCRCIVKPGTLGLHMGYVHNFKVKKLRKKEYELTDQYGNKVVVCTLKLNEENWEESKAHEITKCLSD